MCYNICDLSFEKGGEAMSYKIADFEINGAVFDLDGTLLDSTDVWRDVDIKFFKNRGREVPADYFERIKSMNFPTAAVFTKNEYNIKESTDEIIAEWFSYAYDAYANEIELKDGAFEFLHRLKNAGVKLAVATASDKRLFTAVLKRHNIYDLFDVFCTTEQVERGKGFPDIYLLASDSLGLKSSECIVFEDIAQGIKGAMDGGFKTCAVYDKHSHEFFTSKEPKADLFIEDFKNL